MTKKGAASVLLFVHEENDKEVYNDTTKGRFHRNSARYGSSEPGDLAERAEKAVCASDYPAIVGLSSFKTPVDIFEDKIDPDAISEEVTLGTKFRYDIGHALEPVILETIALEIGAIPVRDKRMVESTRYPYMRADIDGLL